MPLRRHFNELKTFAGRGGGASDDFPVFSCLQRGHEEMTLYYCWIVHCQPTLCSGILFKLYNFAHCRYQSMTKIYVITHMLMNLEYAFLNNWLF